MTRHLHIHVHDAEKFGSSGEMNPYATKSNSELASLIKKASGQRHALRTLQMMNEEKERRKRAGKWDQSE